MRRDTRKTEVTWNADVSEETLRELDRLLPITGTRTWAINTGLDEFLTVMENDPKLQEWAHADIQRALHVEDTPRGTKALNVKIPADHYNRFNALFPEWGATTWFIRRFVNQFVVELIAAKIDLYKIVRHTIEAATSDIN